MYNNSIETSFILSFDARTSDRKTIETQLEYQVHIGSAQNINSQKYLLVAHQTAARIGVPNKANNVAVFDNLDVRKYFVDFDGVRYRDVVSVGYTSNDFLDQYRDFKVFYKEYVGEELLSPLINYTGMKNKYLIQVIDLRFQVDHNNPRTFQLHQEYRSATNNARLFMILIRHSEINVISDGIKITEVIN